jgi:hypothetical protein
MSGESEFGRSEIQPHHDGLGSGTSQQNNAKLNSFACLLHNVNAPCSLLNFHQRNPDQLEASSIIWYPPTTAEPLLQPQP